MNKIVSFLALFFVLVTLGGCGNQNGTSSAGGNSSSAEARNVTSLPQGAPTITRFYPGWQFAGSAITIYGTNFDPVAANNAVNFSNNISATVASASQTELVVIVPGGTTNGSISVATSSGTATSSTLFVPKTNSSSTAPTIASSPREGILGTTITITGTNFSTTRAYNLVTFNGTPAEVTNASATALEVIVPDAVDGNLTVTTPTGTAISYDTFLVKPIPGSSPTIQNFSPLRGDIGASVTINGTNFDPVAGNNIIKFNGIAASGVAFASSVSSTTGLVVNVPAGATSGPITVKTSSGVTAKSALSFTIPSFGIPATGQKGGAIQGAPLSLFGSVLTFAGGGVVLSAANGDGVNARFNNPNGMTSDGSSIFIADAGNRVIRRVEIATNKVTTIAGSGLLGFNNGTGAGATFATPYGITYDAASQSLFVTDAGNNRIRKISAPTGFTLSTMTDGVVTTLAGNGSVIFKDDPNGLNAGIRSPYGIATDGTNLYVADGSNRIRQVNIATSAVTTFAGSGVYFTGDGSGVNASFNQPRGVAITSDKSTLYVSDGGTNTIRKVVIAGAVVSTLMGPGFSDSSTTPATAGSFQSISDIATDGTNLYVADAGNNSIRKIVLATGALTTLAGTGKVGFADTATDVLATFRYPNGLVSVGSNLYVADSGNNLIRQVVLATQAVTTIAGNVVTPSNINGIGTSSKFNFPYGITTDGGNLYVADSASRLIRKIVLSSGVVTTLAGSGYFGAVDARATAASFNYPFGLTTDGTNVYVADMGNNRIRQISLATGDVTTLAGSGVLGYADAVVGTDAKFNQPAGITTANGKLYVADSGNHKIRQIDIATGEVTTVAGSGSTGSLDGNGTAASFRNPRGITTDGVKLYVADTDNNKIRQIDIASGAVTTLAGSGDYWYNDVYDTKPNGTPLSIITDGAGVATATFGVHTFEKGNEIIISGVTPADYNGKHTVLSANTTTLTFNMPIGTLAATAFGVVNKGAFFRHPVGITTDGTYLYVADAENNEIRKIEIATGVITTLSGSGAFGTADGTGTEASFGMPIGITTDGISLYTTEYLNNLIRKIQ
ncbi:MAG: IPT/TIG domain-containing protein [Gallionellaceae bacterium]|jgi:sugar lactone lactonase YvrE